MSGIQTKKHGGAKSVAAQGKELRFNKMVPNGAFSGRKSQNRAQFPGVGRFPSTGATIFAPP
jgi:hypothetical protein